MRKYPVLEDGVIGKMCTHCKEVKSLSEFGANNHRADKKRSICRLCTNLRRREWKRDNPEKYKANKRRERLRYQLIHPEKGKEARRKYQLKHPDVIAKNTRKWALKHQYGLSLEEYDRLLRETQGGVCAICERTNESGKRLSVDHNHETGKVRGLLCQKCNMMLGFAEDNQNTLFRALVYLVEHDGGGFVGFIGSQMSKKLG